MAFPLLASDRFELVAFPDIPRKRGCRGDIADAKVEARVQTIYLIVTSDRDVVKQRWRC
jgi:hypothetical protein